MGAFMTCRELSCSRFGWGARACRAPRGIPCAQGMVCGATVAGWVYAARPMFPLLNYRDWWLWPALYLVVPPGKRTKLADGRAGGEGRWRPSLFASRAGDGEVLVACSSGAPAPFRSRLGQPVANRNWRLGGNPPRKRLWPVAPLWWSGCIGGGWAVWVLRSRPNWHQFYGRTGHPLARYPVGS